MAAAALASLPLVPRTARACTCPSKWGEVVWPLDGATDVARDTPLVIAHYDFSGEPSSFDYSLVSADGREIALSERQRLPAAFDGCGPDATLFLRPSELLDEGSVYTLSLTGFAPEAPRDPPAVTFTVGAGTFTSEPLQNVEVEYLHVEGTTECYSASCGIAELWVDLGASIQQPRWLEVETAARLHGKNALRFFPVEWPATASRFDRQLQLSVELPAGDRCVQIRLYGLDGALLLDERRCEPDRCARSDLRSGSSCGEPRGSALDPARIPDSSCDNPPIIGWADGVGPVYPEPEPPGDEATTPPEPSAGAPAPQIDPEQNTNTGSAAGAAAPEQAEFRSYGCSAATAGAGMTWLTLALGALWLARRRRRH
jgi:uncharacterized protein (TIGR03382 family)